MTGGPRWRLVIAPGIATLAALAVLVSLGIWQLDRKAWKEGLLRAIDARAFGEPVPPPPAAAWTGWLAGTDEFRRLGLSGRFAGREVLLHGLAEVRRGQALQGFYVFAPFRLDDGAVVMVNRGFVPTELAGAGRHGAEPDGETVVVGLARAPEARGSFVPANDPGRGEWFVRDPAEMGRALGLAAVAPFYVDADASPNPGGWPRGGQTRLTLPNDHLSYALTWFGLALTLVGVFAVFAWRRLVDPSEAGTADPAAARPPA